jgi:ectoine hydroxylase-related dioxygenase (phytanoyl-CoA dioxygenase family)
MATPNFKTIPAGEELANIERDLNFYPVANDHPQVLTAAQINSFNERGYVAPIDIFPPNEIADIRAYFDRLLEEEVARGGNSYSISTAHLKHAPVYDILTDARIIAVVSDLLGENVIGWGSHFFCKMPGDGKRVSWHQDASYWPMSKAKNVTVWLAIDGADTENACMRFLAGSHHFGHVTYRASSPEEHNTLDQTIVDAEQYGEPVDDVLQAGQVSLHSDLLLHGSEANQSQRRRCGLTLRYCSADVRAGLDWNQKGVIVRGTDPSGHWANPSRPE